jgi:hypothetical protein
MPPSVSAPGRRLVGGLLVVCSLLGGTQPLAAQDIVRSSATWRTLRTQWFEIHYPTDTEAWVQDLAPRLDATRDAVAALVGYAPSGRTTVLVDDPYNVANGKAIPLLRSPVIHLWVTPPTATDQIANHRGWGEKLAAHEFGHIAHLSRPVRRSQWYWHLLPAQVSALAVSSPRWAAEGYATWIEGKITGSGRPHGAWRPALLRELALAGRLPSYTAMSAGSGYKGGSMAYLAGSAFWEWLEGQRGDTSMTLVFRRQSARTARSFDDAFRGVYGEPPAAMYARFSAELTTKAFAVDAALRQRGVVDGILMARYARGAGGPAVTRDGRRVALTLPGLGAAPRVIVAPTDTQAITTLEQQAVQRLLQRDPQDVPAVRTTPRLAKPAATLMPRRGRTFGHPRFIDSAGTQLLLESWAVRRDGTQRPDLAIWNATTRRVRFVTDGAAVQDADPSPDGTRAVAVRCVGGSCGLVLVSLATGAVTPLAAGAPRRVYSHPRWSPDGARIVTSVQDTSGVWQLALLDAATGAEQIVSPRDGVNRHSPSFDAAGTGLVYVSEEGGIPDVESMRLSDRTSTRRTRVTGSVYEPLPLPDGGVLFFSEYSEGMELRRLAGGTSVPAAEAIAGGAGLVPAMPRAVEPGVVLTPRPVPPSTPYGNGPRTVRFAAQTAMAREGIVHGAVITSADPANRLVWTLTGMGGAKSAWRGGVASGAWYGARPAIRAESFWLEQRPGLQRDRAVVGAPDLRLAGGSLAAELAVAGATTAQRLSVSAFGGAAGPADTVRLRTTLSAAYSISTAAGWRRFVGASVRSTAGRLGDSSFVRASAGVWGMMSRTRIDARWHRASRGTPVLEQFAAGGFAPPLADAATLSQRIALPALPVGIVRGLELFDLRIARPAPLLPLNLYAHSTGTTWRADRHSVVLGAEREFAMEYLGLVGLPRMQFTAGVARIMRGPLRDKGSAYLSFGWRP